MRRFLTTFALVALLVALAGCSDSGEKGKNKDKDVPKPAKSES
jgi:predicted small lipoprotein YifL